MVGALLHGVDQIADRDGPQIEEIHRFDAKDVEFSAVRDEDATTLGDASDGDLGVELGEKVQVAPGSCDGKFMRRLSGWLSDAGPCFLRNDGDVGRRIMLKLDCCAVELDRDELPLASDVVNLENSFRVQVLLGL